MSKTSAFTDWLPPQATVSLANFGLNLALARVRRKESLRGWAKRIGVSVQTVRRLEAGDPGVSMGAYLAVLWIIGRDKALPEIADPALDGGALELDLRKAMERLQRRHKDS